MISNENESSTKAVTNELNTNSVVETNSNMSSINESMSNENGAENAVQPKTDQENNEINDNDQQQIEEQEQQDDEFIRITAAHQILTEAQLYDDQKNYPAALQLYRICVDLLLEELMFTEGTEQSRVYLREKCTAIMDHIDFLKTKLEPIPISEPVTEKEQTQAATATTTTTTAEATAEATAEKVDVDESTTKPPTDQLDSLHIS